MADLVPMSQAATTSLVTTLQNTDLFALAREDSDSETGYKSKVARVDAMAKKVANETDYSQLQTTNKKIIGAINEVNAKASQFDNMTDTASGSIASFDDGGDDIPVKSFECEIVATGGGGSPSTPIPINGFSQADIPVRGKNWFDIESWLTACGVTYTKNNDRYTITPNSAMYNTPYKFSETDVLVSASVTDFQYNGTNLRLEFLNSNGASQTVITSGTLTRENFTANQVRLNWSAMGTSVTIEKPMINLGETASDYTPFVEGNFYTVAFGQTVYGGRLIYANGEWAIRATHGYYEITGGENWAWAKSGSYPGGFYTPVASVGSKANSPFICSHARTVTNIADYTNGTCYCDGSLNFRIMNAEDTVTDWINYLATQYANGTPVTICYELATPTIIPITSSTRVKTISGDNNISSNTGDCDLEYFTNKADSLAELIKAFVV